MQELDLLILGAGWTSTFLLPLLSSRSLTHASTSTTGRPGTIKFKYDPSISDPSYFAVLPLAKTVLITFPLTGEGQSRQILEGYAATHKQSNGSSEAGSSSRTQWIQLGSTGIYQIESQELWVTRHSKYNNTNARAIAEDELIGLGGCVLNLAGLWGGERQPRKWVDRVADSKEKVRGKTSLHMVHGDDVARAIVAVMGKWEKARGQRWMLTDGFVYDWWALFAGWGGPAESAEEPEDGERIGKKEIKPSKQSRWVFELMEEGGVRALPRSMETLGRCYDSREFWQTFGLSPLRSRI